MYVKCIDIERQNSEVNLTLEKIYEVLEENSHKYRIVDDNGINRVYFKSRFVVVNPESKKVSKKSIWEHHK